MRTLNYPGAQGTAAYHNTMHIAAHLSMKRTPRYDIFITRPGASAPVKLTDTSPLYRDAVQEIASGGGLEIGETGRWESEGCKFVARRA
jgi:hypothetical protein